MFFQTVAVTSPNRRNPQTAAQSLFVFFLLAVHYVLPHLAAATPSSRPLCPDGQDQTMRQKKPSGASLVRRQPPPRSEKALKRSERTAAAADMRRRQALFPSIYADDQEKLQAVDSGRSRPRQGLTLRLARRQ